MGSLSSPSVPQNPVYGSNHLMGNDHPDLVSPKGYALSGKIMLSAIVILFAVVVFMICLHVYARWYLLRARRRHLRRRTRNRTHVVFYVDPNTPNAAAARGLDAAVLSSLPAFLYSAKTHPAALECAVCLSEFEENEKIRLLPKCNHSFHIECIDMWFHSHSTCPLCRSPVDPMPENRPDVVISVDETEAGSSSGSGFCATCQEEGQGPSSSSSLGDRRKGFEFARVTVEVPRRTESEIELGTSLGFKSPATRLQSLKRILSLNRKGSAVSPSSGVGTSCGSAAASELDVECGRDESTQQQTRVQTPR